MVSGGRPRGRRQVGCWNLRWLARTLCIEGVGARCVQAGVSCSRMPAQPVAPDRSHGRQFHNPVGSPPPPSRHQPVHDPAPDPLAAALHQAQQPPHPASAAAGPRPPPRRLPAPAQTRWRRTTLATATTSQRTAGTAMPAAAALSATARLLLMMTPARRRPAAARSRRRGQATWARGTPQPTALSRRSSRGALPPPGRAAAQRLPAARRLQAGRQQQQQQQQVVGTAGGASSWQCPAPGAAPGRPQPALRPGAQALRWRASARGRLLQWQLRTRSWSPSSSGPAGARGALAQQRRRVQPRGAWS